MTTKYRGQPTQHYSGSEPPVYNPRLDFKDTELVGLRVFVWSREAEDEYAGVIEQYHPDGWPMYVVLIDAVFQEKYDAPCRVMFNEGSFTDSGSYRIVGATTDKGEPGTIEVPKSITLPGEMYMALITRRPELAKMLRANVNKGKELTPEEVDGILTLAEQTIEAEAALVATLADHRKAIKDMLSNAAGVVTALNRMVEQLDTHTSNVGGQGGRS